jgi:ribokinase
MRIFNFGSLNIDHVYSVERFVRPGETIPSLSYRRYSGGKGGNQSIALAHAGASVTHMGRIGADGTWVRDRLKDSGVDVSLITTGSEPTGHAIIQVSQQGENAIVIYGGANQTLSEADVDSILMAAETGDYVLTQNETSCVGVLLKRAREKGLFTVFNPAPVTESVRSYPLDKVKLFILNETEGRGLTEMSTPNGILDALVQRYPEARVVLTLGDRGARYRDQEIDVSVPAEKVETVDTTAAGDTFIGYFLAEFSTGGDIERCLRMACRASAVCVQRAGAADSIPERYEVTTT